MAKRKVFSPMICEFLFFEEDGDKKEKTNYIDLKIQIRELIKNPIDRAVLTAVLLDLRKDVTGKTRTELLRVYQDLELHKDAYKKLGSWRWEIISKGIYELTQMEVKDSYSLITRFINDKRATIRKQAELATVSLMPEGINYFLDHTKYKISEWQQLKLLDVVRNKIDYEPPPFRLWLTSKNNHVVLFALRLIKYYNQNDASASLIQLLRHKSNHIKKEAIFCIRDFHVVDAVPVLKTIFWKCTNDVKMFILEALSQLGTEDDIGFLQDLLTKEMAFTVKGKAISAINTIRPEGVMPTNDILPNEDFEAVVPMPSSVNSLSKEPIVEPKEDIPVTESTEITVMIQGTEKDNIALEISNDEIAFLPIVTEEPIKSVPTETDKYLNNDEEQIGARQLNVDYQEIFPSATVEDLHFHFLPIVVEEPGLAGVTSANLNELPINYEEVIVAKTSVNECANWVDDSIDFLSVIFEDIEVPKELTSDKETVVEYIDRQTEINFSDNIASESFEHLRVIYDTITIDKTSSSLEFIQDIDWEKAFKPEPVEEVEKNTSKADIDPNFAQESWNVPKPLFYDDEILNVMVLLEDIADLGDSREIPHLNMLLQKETNVTIKNRINEIISHFSITEDIGIDFELNIEDERQSVFQSLFEVSDTDAKIILLAEIAEVGDEMEIPLLKTFMENGDAQLRKAGKEALDKLSYRLSTETCTAIFETPLVCKGTNTKDIPELDVMFNVEFDYIGSETVTKTTEIKPTRQNDRSTLFDHLCAMSTKFYNKEL